MYVMTIDQVGSRTRADRVPDLLSRLEDTSTLAPFERTVGDEVQGIPADAQAVLRVVTVLLRDGGLSPSRCRPRHGAKRSLPTRCSSVPSPSWGAHP